MFQNSIWRSNRKLKHNRWHAPSASSEEGWARLFPSRFEGQVSRLVTEATTGPCAPRIYSNPPVMQERIPGVSNRVVGSQSSSQREDGELSGQKSYPMRSNTEPVPCNHLSPFKKENVDNWKHRSRQLLEFCDWEYDPTWTSSFHMHSPERPSLSTLTVQFANPCDLSESAEVLLH